MDISNPIEITIVLGDLEDHLKNMDVYGLYLRGFNPDSTELADEPEKDLETVLVMMLKIEEDHEPQWSLLSPRAEQQGQTRSLSWKDRLMLSPTRLGALPEYHLGWRKGSLLHKISDEKADASGALTQAVRDVRSSFGDQANEQLSETLGKVASTANNLGIVIGDKAQALIDMTAISFNGGTVSLHNEYGVPLTQLGLGSTRLLIAGLQKLAAENTSMILIDELEYGLEPHRIIRLLDTLGAKSTSSPLQVFMTTHSPVAVRELSGDQLMIMRCVEENHIINPAGTIDAIQGTIRKFPEALLAPIILVCEGASEVGLMRGIDQYYTEDGKRSILSYGATLVDGVGHTAIARAITFQSLGYKVALLCDSDVPINGDQETDFITKGGKIFQWREDHALEDELFSSLSDHAIEALLDLAKEYREVAVMNDQIKSKSENRLDWETAYLSMLIDGSFSKDTRRILGKASRHKEAKKSWYKSVSAMERIGKEIVGPNLADADEGFKEIIDSIFQWVEHGNA